MISIKRYYASHLREIPLDDGTKPASSGEVYDIHEADLELARLRERVAELEQELACPRPVNGKDTKADCIAAGQCGCNVEACSRRNRERLLLEALRWCLQHGAKTAVVFNSNSNEYIDGFRNAGCDCCSNQIDPPTHLAPLIAEAVKP